MSLWRLRRGCRRMTKPGTYLVPRSGGGPEEVSLTACPLPWCEHVFEDGEQRHHHFEVAHRPEDFGLSPIRTRAAQSRLEDYDMEELKA